MFSVFLRLKLALEKQGNKNVFSSFSYHCIEVVREWVTTQLCFAHV